MPNILLGTPQILVKSGSTNVGVSVGQPNMLVKVGSGPEGPPGPAGPAGPTGPQGPEGFGLKITGTVPTSASLPMTGNTNGDLWVALDTSHGWVWETSAWSDIGPIKGPPGSTGPQGPIGATGPVGAQGNAGPQGPSGATGPSGVQGPIGPAGATGAIGATGATGPQGVAGATGAQGITGATGPIGQTGGTGPQGVAGPAGVAGPQGQTGLTGPQGATGTQGLTGPQGPTGSTGPQGATGPQGNPGPAGSTGATGLTGAQGPAGPQGAQGPVGPQGTGITVKGTVPTAADLPTTGNTKGDLWIAADTGHGWTWSGTAWQDTGPVQGPPGPSGPQGPTGAMGSTGPTGPAGATGATGATGPAGMTWRGAWLGATTYAINDAVGFGGSSYICVTSNVGNAPPNATYWSLVAQIGATGVTGPTGPTGATGVQGPQGATGQTGATGPAGAAGAVGPPGMTWRGAWASGTAYAVNDVVGQGGSSYICVSANTGNQPPNATYWSLVAQIGATGAQGPTGAQGVQGVTGATGATGGTGPQGVPGATGATGPQGPAGPTGATGPAGPTAVSSNAGNLATLGSDSLILVPQSSLWSMRLRSFNVVGNPTFEVDQINVGNLVANANGKIIDRWQIGRAGTLAVSTQQFLAPTPPTLPGTNFTISRNYFRITLTTTEPTLVAGDFLYLVQYVEGPCWRELQSDVHSVQVLVRSSVAGQSFGVTVHDTPGTSSLTNLLTVPTANTWTLLTLPNLPVWPTANFVNTPGSNAYQLLIALACGSTYTTPANGSWQNGNFLGAVGQSNFAASPVNSTFDIAFVQHEPGPVCTTPIDCPFTQNLDDCLRYFQKTYDYDMAIGTVNAVGDVGYTQFSTTQGFGVTRFHKPMAKIPTLTAYNTITGATNSLRQQGGTDYTVSNFNAIGKAGFFGITFSATPAIAVGATVRFHYTADTGW